MRRLFFIMLMAANLPPIDLKAADAPAAAIPKGLTNQSSGGGLKLLTAENSKLAELKFDRHSLEYQRAWSRATTVDEYRRSGKTNAAWDDVVISAMEDYVELTAHKSDDDSSNLERMRVIGEKAERAVKLGCEDALVKYFRIRYGMGLDRDKNYSALLWNYQWCAEALDKTDYHPVRKFLSHFRASEFTRFSPPQSKPEQIAKNRKAFIHLAEVALQDTTMPPDEAFELANSTVHATRDADDGRTNLEVMLLPALEKYWAKEGFSYAVRGRYFIDEAWRARGGGYADSVTDAGWKGFEAQLAKASEILRKGWEVDPTCIYVPIDMITVCMGRGEPRSEMEKWFERAMALDPDSYEAVSAKAYYLQPKWLGSVPEVLAFGYECVTSKRWGGKIPLILAGIHNQLRIDYQAPEEKYYGEKVVWRDIKASYERFFELNPNDVSHRPEYARDAFRCGQYNVFLEQLPKFGAQTNYIVFRGKDKFDEMVRKAVAATSI